MGTSVIPQFIDALYSRAVVALPNIQVTDGVGVTADPGDFLMIGVDDPNSPNFAASAGQVIGPLGPPRPRDQTGTLTCVAYASNGDGDQKAARDAAYSYMAAVENIVRTEPNLGIAAGGMFVAQMGSKEDLSQAATSQGIDALLIFDIAFFARI